MKILSFQWSTSWTYSNTAWIQHPLATLKIEKIHTNFVYFYYPLCVYTAWFTYVRWPGIFRLMLEITVLSYWASNIKKKKNQFFKVSNLFSFLWTVNHFFLSCEKVSKPKRNLNMLYGVFVKITVTLHENFS